MIYLFYLSNCSIVDADNRVIDRCRGWCSMAGIPFYRFSPHMATDIELDETDDKTLVDLMWSAMVYIHSRKDDVLRLKEILKNWISDTNVTYICYTHTNVTHRFDTKMMYYGWKRFWRIELVTRFVISLIHLWPLLSRSEFTNMWFYCHTSTVCAITDLSTLWN